MRVISSLFLFAFIITINAYSQTGKEAMPVFVSRANDTSKPVLFYISGDGGWNKFSIAFIHHLNFKGYEIVGLNAREYFWHKKDAVQTAKDMSSIISGHMKTMKKKSFILIGYSFGADVIPFIVTHSEAGILDSLRNIILMSPSAKTDFEVHISDLLGIENNDGESVPDEINKISKPVLFVFGDKEDNFPLKQILITNYKVARLPGGHHYDGEPEAVYNAISSFLK